MRNERALICTDVVCKLKIHVELACSQPIGPLHDQVTWHGINYTGPQITQWDSQNKGNSDWTGTSFFFEVPLHILRPSVRYLFRTM